jgi:hypothetical protein
MEKTAAKKFCPNMGAGLFGRLRGKKGFNHRFFSSICKVKTENPGKHILQNVTSAYLLSGMNAKNPS